MSIFLKKANYKNGRTFLSIVSGYYDPKTKNSKQNTLEKIGFLDELQKDYDNPIEFFTKKANSMNEEINQKVTSILDLSEKLTEDELAQNVGYIFVKQIYKELNLKPFLNSKQKKLKVTYDLNLIFSLLVFSRILYPGSKKETFDKRKRFFEPFEGFELPDLYRALDYFTNYKEEIELLLWNSTKDVYKRDTSHTFYDCTNYYFEINYNDTDLVDEEGNILEKNYRKRGPEKNHRPDPIVEMGLLMDSNDIPLSYDLFPGNESEKLSLRPIHSRTKSKFGLERTVIVADRGLNTSDNIFYLAGRNDKENLDGYIYGQSVRGADKEFKEWVLNQEGYISEPLFDEDGNPEMFRQMIFDQDGKLTGYEKKQSVFKHKSRIYPKEIKIKRDGKRNTKVRTDQKQLVYYSQKYADKQKRDRNQMIERAKDIIAHPKKYDKITAKGAASYINNIKYVKDTGEVAEGLDLTLKLDKIAEEEKYDGYYSIVTSELNMNDYELRKKYRGLAKIEETFKITKTELESRPVFVWTSEHIESHFLTCFVALVIVRLLEHKTNHKYSISKMIESMKNFNVLHETDNVFKVFGYNETIETLFRDLNIDLFKKYMTREKIKSSLKY